MQDSAHMLGFDDERWNHLAGGYKILSTRLLPCENLRANWTPQPLGKSWGRSCITKGTLETHPMLLYRNL